MLRTSLLPVLGAVLLASAPLRARAETPGNPAAASAGSPAAATMDAHKPAIADGNRASAADATSPTAKPSLPALLDTLLHNADNRTETVKSLLAIGDEGLQPLFQNLFKGNVYAYAAPGTSDTLLVMAGPEEQREGETWVPLIKPYPAVPLQGPDGKPAYAKLADIAEVETDRDVRNLIQPVLTAMDLKSRDAAKRRAAALTIGESGDPQQAGLLEKALAVEPNQSVRHLMEEALARLGLHSPEAGVRAAAAAKLGEIHSVNVLPELKALVQAAPEAAATEAAGGPANAAAAALPGSETDPAVRAAAEKAIHSIESFQSFTGVVQNLFTGLSLGSILILMALGLAIIFGLMGVINMAHGEFMMIGAYATYLIQNAFLKWLPPAYFDWFLVVSLPLSFLAAGGIGMFIEATIIKRLYGRPLETLLATWGLSLLLVQTARSLFGDLTAVSTPKLLAKGWEIFPQVVLPFNRIFIMMLTIAIVGAVSWAFYKTSLGTKIRAVTQNRSMSACLGIATRRVDMLTFGLGTGIAGVAGCALTQIGNVDPGMGQNYIVDSFMVVVTGGVGKLAGTVIAGLGIGSLNKFLEPFLQSVYAKVVLLGLVIFFLQNRPSGLFPAKGRNEDL